MVGGSQIVHNLHSLPPTNLFPFSLSSLNSTTELDRYCECFCSSINLILPFLFQWRLLFPPNHSQPTLSPPSLLSIPISDPSPPPTSDSHSVLVFPRDFVSPLPLSVTSFIFNQSLFLSVSSSSHMCELLFVFMLLLVINLRNISY